MESSYQRDLWTNQPIHLEVFSEKDAMTTVLKPVIQKYRITYNMLRGYSSRPIIYRIGQEWPKLGKPIHVLYVGDHDPSGKDMEDNLRFRIKFELRDHRPEIVWKRLAATQRDMERNPNLLLPVKVSDTRASKYIDKHGEHGMEVDAIDNREIVSRLETAIRKRIDNQLWSEALRQEEKDKAKLRSILGY